MEKSETIRCFNQGKHYIETCLEQIASLEQNNDKELRLGLMNKFMVNVSYEAAENFCKVAGYIIDGKDGAQQLKVELISLKEKLVQLYNGADRQNITTIKHISDVILSEIKEVEKWTGDHEQIIQGTNQVANNPIPETGNNNEVYYEYEIFDGVEEKYINKYKKSFNYDEDKYTSFFVKCKGKTPYEIAGMLYNCNDFYNCRAIKAVYFVCVVPTMTDDNHITYEAFLNHYKSIDNAQG